MNAETFADYLAQPAKLYQLSYQEIKNLVVEYPFAANLRYLLLLKAKIEADPKFERYLHQYAAHAPDRPFLYELVQTQLSVLLDLESEHEEKLELLDLSTFQEKEAILLESEQEEQTPPETLRASATPPPAAPVSFPTEEEDLRQEAVQAQAAPSASTSETTQGTSRQPVSDEPSPVPPPPIKARVSPPSEEPVSPLPKAAFNCWQEKPQRPNRHERFARLRSQNLRERTSSSAAQVRKVAKESVAQQTDLATETLAIILERQGQNAKAIEMYERLILLNPEKRRYFAAAIEKLKLKA